MKVLSESLDFGTALGRRWLASEFGVVVVGLAAFLDPLALTLVAGGYILSRSLRKMYRPALGTSGYLTTEFAVLLLAAAKLTYMGAPEGYVGALLAVFCVGRGLGKTLSPGPKSGQHIHL